MQVPELIVFDLDFTLWDCGGTWCDCLRPPFECRRGEVFDSDGRHVRLYDDVVNILDYCEDNNIPCALASRTEKPSWARELVSRLQIESRFAHAEIYPASKRNHFQALKASSNVGFASMLFFDDEMRNIREVGSLGVDAVFVADGMSRALFDNALGEFST